MPKQEDMLHSMLIVSGSDQFTAFVKNAMPPGRFMPVEYRKNAAAARRSILERYYDMVVINMPLPDEFGTELAMDTAENSNIGVLAVVPQGNYEDIQDRTADLGIVVISKPFSGGQMKRVLRFLMAVQHRMHCLEQKAEAARQRAEELQIIDKAKFLLLEKEHMTENEAHRYIGKQAMDSGVSRLRIAERILEEYD